MIWVAFGSVIVSFFNALLFFLPKVTTLPPIFGYDIDTTLTTGMASFYQFIHYIWPLQIVFNGLLAILAYHALKMLAIAILGARVPH